MQQVFFERFFKYGDKEYFSFYLTSDHNSSESELRNEAENTHYDYIWNFLAWQLESDKIEVDAAFFKSQLDLKYEREKRNREYELKRITLQNAVINFTPEAGKLVAIRDWRDNPIRIGKIENVMLPNKRQVFSIDILEVKKSYSWQKGCQHMV